MADKTMESLERNRRQRKQIDCRHAVHVIVEKRSAALLPWRKAAARLCGTGLD
jgi:hypothetical protein